MAKVTMPQLGESVAEGTIGKWLKQPGDHVDKYEPLVEVVTDKVNAEVPSPFEGILREILAEEGSVVPNNAEIAVIETADDGGFGADAPAAPAAATAAAPDEAPAAAERDGEGSSGGCGCRTPQRPPPRRGARTIPPGRPAPTSAAQPRWRPRSRRPRRPRDPDARMTPAVRRLLREHELTAAQIVGTGGGGRITREDVLKVVESIRTGGAAPAPAPAVAPASGQNGSAAPAAAPARAPPHHGHLPRAARRRADRVPRGCRRSPPADDQDAQGDRGADDPGARGPARVRPHGGRRHQPGARPRDARSATTRPARGSRSATSRS